MFGKLLPREGNFFELFNQHGRHIAEGSKAFLSLVEHYPDVEQREKRAAEVDRVMRAAMSKLFRKEPDVRELIKLKAIYELLESISDRCEDAANTSTRVSCSRNPETGSRSSWKTSRSRCGSSSRWCCWHWPSTSRMAFTTPRTPSPRSSPRACCGR
jgi:hypothetical protein